MSRLPLVNIPSPTGDQPAFPCHVTQSPSPPAVGEMKPLQYPPSYIKNTPSEPPGGSGSGITSGGYSPPYISSGAGSPRDNVSPSFPGNTAYGGHTTDYSTHSSNSQSKSNGPWARHTPTNQPANKSMEPNITINPTPRLQNNQFPTQGAQVVIQQPKPQSITTTTSEPQQDWNSALCQCCDGTNTCFGICCCLPCFVCWLSNRMEEGCCMPLCVPLSVMALRMKARYQNNIKGSIVGDFCASLWCCPCVLCQLKRELDYRETQQSVSRQSNFV